MNPLLGTQLEFRKNVIRNLSGLGLKASQPKILYYLYTHEGCRQKDVAENCFVETATLSSVLSNLEERGFITRSQDKEDKRAYRIYATDEGREVMKAVDDQVRKSEKIALEGFTEDEIKQFTAYLERACKNLTDSNLK